MRGLHRIGDEVDVDTVDGVLFIQSLPDCGFDPSSCVKLLSYNVYVRSHYFASIVWRPFAEIDGFVIFILETDDYQVLCRAIMLRKRGRVMNVVRPNPKPGKKRFVADNDDEDDQLLHEDAQEEDHILNGPQDDDEPGIDAAFRPTHGPKHGRIIRSPFDVDLEQFVASCLDIGVTVARILRYDMKLKIAKSTYRTSDHLSFDSNTFVYDETLAARPARILDVMLRDSANHDMRPACKVDIARSYQLTDDMGFPVNVLCEFVPDLSINRMRERNEGEFPNIVNLRVYDLFQTPFSTLSLKQNTPRSPSAAAWTEIDLYCPAAHFWKSVISFKDNEGPKTVGQAKRLILKVFGGLAKLSSDPDLMMFVSGLRLEVGFQNMSLSSALDAYQKVVPNFLKRGTFIERFVVLRVESWTVTAMETMIMLSSLKLLHARDSTKLDPVLSERLASMVFGSVGYVSGYIRRQLYTTFDYEQRFNGLTGFKVCTLNDPRPPGTIFDRKAPTKSKPTLTMKNRLRLQEMRGMIETWTFGEGSDMMHECRDKQGKPLSRFSSVGELFEDMAIGWEPNVGRWYTQYVDNQEEEEPIERWTLFVYLTVDIEGDPLPLSPDSFHVPDLNDVVDTNTPPKVEEVLLPDPESDDILRLAEMRLRIQIFPSLRLGKSHFHVRTRQGKIGMGANCLDHLFLLLLNKYAAANKRHAWKKELCLFPIDVDHVGDA